MKFKALASGYAHMGNPDGGLKFRPWDEVEHSLRNTAAVAQQAWEGIHATSH